MADWLIDTEHLFKAYQLGPQTLLALNDVSVRIAPGEFVAVMGPSGSGKSTFMNVLGCLDSPTSGTYRLAGQDVSNLPPDSLARIRNQLIGFVFQRFNLLPRTTALENVELPLVYSGVPARERHAPGRGARSREVGLADRRAPALAALGRPAAARRHRAGAGQRAAADPGRRADRRARLRGPRSRSWRCSSGLNAAWHDGGAGDARAGYRRLRPAHDRASATAADRRRSRSPRRAGARPHELARHLRSRCARSALNKLRSVLTMLGIIIGVGAVITMIGGGGAAPSERVAEQMRASAPT